MNRRIPLQQETDPVRQIGLQTILLGMEATFDASLRAINDVRDQLGHPRVSVLRGVVQTDPEDVPVLPAPGNTPALRLSPAAEANRSKRSLAGKGVGKMWEVRKAILEAAGMQKKGSGLPSNALIEKARRKLTRLGKPIPGTKPGRPAGTKRAKVAATKKTPTKNFSAKAKKSIADSAKADWALARKAGLNPKGRPNKETLELARAILQGRNRRAVVKSKRAVPAARRTAKVDKVIATPENVPENIPQEVVEPAT